MKLSEKARKIIGAVAPGLGAALGGPLGGLAGNMIADALGGEGNVEKALLAQKPEILLALKAADQAFEARMEELQIDRERLYVGDVASAREMAKINMVPQIVLSALFVLGYFVLLLSWMLGDIAIPESGHDLFVGLIAVLGAAVTQILNFWFGSSHGSAVKNNAMMRAPQ